MIRGTKRKMDSTPTKRFDVGASIHNRFDIEVVDAVSGEVKRKAFAENVICNQLWTRLLAGNSWNSYICYGDGSGVPSASDTSLFSHLGTEQSTVYNLDYDYDTNVFTCTKKIVVDETKAVGKTLTEVGIAYSNATSTLCTHAMFKDMNGNTVSLEKSDTDIFNIYATVFVHISTPSEYVRFMAPRRYNKDWRESGLLQFFSGISANPTLNVPIMFGMIPYAGSGFKNVTPAYDSTARKITYTADRLPASEFNAGGLPAVIFRAQTSSGYGPTEIVFEVNPDDGWFGGTRITGEAIGTGDGATTDFATALGYASNAKVYVDGIETPVIVDCINHILHQKQSSYSCLAYPIPSYFRLLRAPEVGYGFSSPNWYHIAPMVLFNSDFCLGRIFEHPPIFENTLYKTVGITQLHGARSTVKVSNDMVAWVTLSDPSLTSDITTVTVPEEYQHYRYWSIQNHVGNVLTNSSRRSYRIYSDKGLASMTKNVHFSEPPPAGAVITADYDAICVGKDENHVFDFSVVFSFNEYTEG